MINLKLGPPVPVEERISLREKLILLRGLIAPLILVGLVLGLLFGGIATPVEAAGIGSFGAIVVAIMHGKFSISGLREASVTTAKASAMVLWIMFGASVFVGFYILQGGQQFVTDAILGTGLSAYGILFLLMFLLVILGMFLDWVGILLLAVPIFIPIVEALEFTGLFGFPPVSGEDVVLWFGVLYGEHADVVSQSALRVCAVLYPRCLPAGDFHGHDLSFVPGIPGDSGFWPIYVHPDSGHCDLVARTGLRLIHSRSNALC